ncbi:MAG: tetratricopeptide repeat protein, partial [Planctomycetota bacterium]
ETTENVAFEPQPAKARAWFERARHATDTRNYEYAVDCFLNGIKFDPGNMSAHEDLLKAANMYRSTSNKKFPSKKIRDTLGDKRPVDKLAAAELAWANDPTDANAALKTMKYANEVGQPELAYWVGDLGVRALVRGKKVTKNQLIPFIDQFEGAGAFEKAVEIGEAALRIDPSDANLQGRVRNLSAQATMNKGSYEDSAGQEGGFRASVRDMSKQQQLSEDEAIAASEDTQQSRLARAKEQYDQDPTDQSNIARFGDLLRKQGNEEAEKKAIAVYLKGFKDTEQYRFRVAAGDIKLAMERRKLRRRRQELESAGETDGEAMEKLKQAERELAELEVREFRERSEQYPTDLGLKLALGEKLHNIGEYEQAIPVLQAASDDARYRARTQHLIGKCFLKSGWYEEAVESLRAAAEAYELKDDDRHLEMRYDLMDALEHYARDHDDLEAADEAARLASGIALKQINFRDIRARREGLRELVKSLRKGGSSEG